MTDAAADWRRRRNQAVEGHAAAMAADRAAQSAEAAELLADFVHRAHRAGLRPTRLVARAVNGRSCYRTRLRGWYLKVNRSVAVGEDAAFYVLTVPASLRARLTGAELQPSIPRLVIGAGGGDGETMPLQQLLQRRLDAPDAWP